MSMLKDYIWDYEHLTPNDMKAVQLAEQSLSTAVHCMVAKFPGLKIGLIRTNDHDRFVYNFCTAFGETCYYMVVDCGTNPPKYLVTNKDDKRMVSTNSYNYFVRGINKPWKKDNCRETAQSLALEAKAQSFYTSLISRIRSLASTSTTDSGRVLSTIENNVKHSLYNFTAEAVYKILGSAFGYLPQLGPNTNSKLLESFNEAKECVETRTSFEEAFNRGKRIVLSKTNHGYTVARFNNLTDSSYEPGNLISVKWLRNSSSLLNDTSMMAQFALLNAHTGKNMLDLFVQGNSLSDARYKDVYTLVIAHHNTIVFHGE